MGSGRKSEINEVFGNKIKIKKRKKVWVIGL
jgi:hypothetical protein